MMHRAAALFAAFTLVAAPALVRAQTAGPAASARQEGLWLTASAGIWWPLSTIERQRAGFEFATRPVFGLGVTWRGPNVSARIDGDRVATRLLRGGREDTGVMHSVSLDLLLTDMTGSPQGRVVSNTVVGIGLRHIDMDVLLLDRSDSIYSLAADHIAPVFTLGLTTFLPDRLGAGADLTVRSGPLRTSVGCPGDSNCESSWHTEIRLRVTGGVRFLHRGGNAQQR